MSQGKRSSSIFDRFTTAVSDVLGHAWVFITALILLLAWGVSGPVFGFSDTWQLIINTSTTIITFLMVFIIQNTQNRDNLAVNVKLDAIMHKLHITDKDLLDAEEASEEELKKQRKAEQRQQGAGRR